MAAVALLRPTAVALMALLLRLLWPRGCSPVALLLWLLWSCCYGCYGLAAMAHTECVLASNVFSYRTDLLPKILHDVKRDHLRFPSDLAALLEAIRARRHAVGRVAEPRSMLIGHGELAAKAASIVRTPLQQLGAVRGFLALFAARGQGDTRAEARVCVCSHCQMRACACEWTGRDGFQCIRLRCPLRAS
jgi:hypothetical protein